MILGASLTLAFFIITLVVGFTVNWVVSLAVVLVYIIVLLVSISACTPSISKMLRAKHFLLAYGLRAWNNRIFLKHGIELRPGYLARWIEVRAISKRNRAAYLKSVEKRVKEQNLTHKIWEQEE